MQQSPQQPAQQRTYDATVVGGGIIGAATAYRLARAGMRVLLLEAKAVAGGASNNSFAWLNSEHKRPDAYHRLNAAGVADYAALEAEAPAVQVHRTGSLHWPVLPGEDAALEERRQRLAGLDYRARWVTRDEVAALEPHLRLPESTERALFFEDDAWVDPLQVVRAILAAAGDAVEVREHTEALVVERQGGVVTGVRTPAGTFATGAVVLCAGVGTQALAGSLGVTLPVERKPGLLIVTTPLPEGVLQRVVHHGLDPEVGCHLRPDINGGVRIGADMFDRPMREDTVVEPPPPFAAELLQRAAGVLPALGEASIARAHLGVRPVPADGFSVAGRLPGFENAYVAVTHSGVTMGPLLGRLVAAEVIGAPADPLLADFRPERFAVPT